MSLPGRLVNLSLPRFHSCECSSDNVNNVQFILQQASMKIKIRNIAGQNIIKAIFSKENLMAFALALILIALVILTANTAPTWIYQGF